MLFMGKFLFIITGLKKNSLPTNKKEGMYCLADQRYIPMQGVLLQFFEGLDFSADRWFLVSKKVINADFP